MSGDRMFSSESGSDSEDEDVRPSRPKKTFKTVKLIGRKGYGGPSNFSTTSSSSASSRSPSPASKKSSTGNAKPSPSSSTTTTPTTKKLCITIKKSPNLELQSKTLSGFKQDSSDSDSSDSEVTINTSRLSNGGADTSKRKSIFGLTRVPAKSTVSPSKKLSKFDLLTQGMNLADQKEESIKRVVPEDSQEENNVENDTS